MKSLEVKSNPEVEFVFASYPDSVRKKMMILRELVIATAMDIDGLTHLVETLKWE